MYATTVGNTLGTEEKESLENELEIVRWHIFVCFTVLALHCVF